jgi:DNA-binding NarL/FixJ family response regulator
VIRLLLVDRVRLVCDVIGAALHGETDIEVIGTAITEEDALRELEQSECDIMLVGTSLPDEGAMSLVSKVRDEEMDVKVLVMGVPDTEPVIMAYLNAGAFGYVLRDDPIQELLANIRAAYEDQALVTPAVAARLIARIAELSQQLTELGVDASDYEELTPREREILALIAEGMSNQEIADHLVIEMGTVKNHVHSILDKLNVNSRKDAALYLTLMADADTNVVKKVDTDGGEGR